MGGVRQEKSRHTMAEPENAEFDPSLKKKKKKKKKEAVAEEAPAEEGAPEPAPAVEEAAVATEEGEPDLGKKKKKKKSKPAAEDKKDSDDDESFGTFVATKKKKKPKKVDADLDGDDEDGGDAGAAAESDPSAPAASKSKSVSKSEKPKKEAPAWHGVDRMYEYDELLTRIFSMLNPEQGVRQAFKMKPPVVVKDGTKRVVLVNFQEVCTSMNRTAEHLLSFMLAELGTSGSLDGQGRVTFKYAGRQAQKHMESVIKQYVKEYVLCKLCRSSDTKLTKDSATRLYFMVCGSCGATRSVNPIKSGFQAQIGKRKKKV